MSGGTSARTRRRRKLRPAREWRSLLRARTAAAAPPTHPHTGQSRAILQLAVAGLSAATLRYMVACYAVDVATLLQVQMLPPPQAVWPR